MSIIREWIVDEFKRIVCGKRYYAPRKIEYFSLRYNKWVTVPKGYPSDGATGAIDINTQGWWVHDVLCDKGTWDDGTPVTNWQASQVLSDILASEGRWFRKHTWFWATWILGGGEARGNGLW